MPSIHSRALRVAFALTPLALLSISAVSHAQTEKVDQAAMQKIRDESHRFAVTYHRKRRQMRDRDSELLSIPGVGPRTRQRLIEHFGSVRGIRQAAPDALPLSLADLRSRLAQCTRVTLPALDDAGRRIVLRDRAQ